MLLHLMMSDRGKIYKFNSSAVSIKPMQLWSFPSQGREALEWVISELTSTTRESVKSAMAAASVENWHTVSEDFIFPLEFSCQDECSTVFIYLFIMKIVRKLRFFPFWNFRVFFPHDNDNSPSLNHVQWPQASRKHVEIEDQSLQKYQIVPW